MADSDVGTDNKAVILKPPSRFHALSPRRMDPMGPATGWQPAGQISCVGGGGLAKKWVAGPGDIPVTILILFAAGVN